MTFFKDIKEMRSYLLLWLTQMISGLGSAMTAYALVIWSYTQARSALRTALLMVCSYAPYVICSIFAGALSDRWDKKKTMLICDVLAAFSRVFAARNSFQFFTIPVGYFLGGLLVDKVFEPIMAMQTADDLLVKLFGSGKGSGAAFLFAVLWIMGVGICLLFRGDKHIRKLEE